MVLEGSFLQFFWTKQRCAHPYYYDHHDDDKCAVFLGLSECNIKMVFTQNEILYIDKPIQYIK